MNIDITADVTFDSQPSFLDFVGLNELAHNAIVNAAVQKGFVIQSRPLDNPLGNMKGWLLDHYIQHKAEFDALGLTGLPDISTVDLEDKEQFKDYMQIHASLHELENAKVGLT